MPDDHTHDPATCGHHHNLTPNPFTDPPREVAYREFMMQMFRMGCLTVTLSVEQTVAYTGLACMGMTPDNRADAIVTFKALLWELARLTCDLSGGKPLEFKVEKRCEDPTHHHDYDENDLNDDENDFNSNLMKAFFTASAEGDLDAAVRVGDAVAREAAGSDRQPEGYVVGLLANCLASLAYTTVRQNPSPARTLFEDD